MTIVFLSLREEEVLGLERLRLAIRRLSQLRMKPWLRKYKVLAEETEAHRG